MKKLLLLLLLTSSLHATEYAPWFSPLWEFQGQLSYLYDHRERIDSPKGDFRDLSNIHTLSRSLGVTVWPYWNVEIELFLSKTTQISFSYQAAYGTVRYQWLDDIRGDPFALATGMTFSFPGKRYLRDFSFPYHGEVNAELHAAFGKEWACGREWWTRGWILGGWGISNRGSGWLHGIAVWEYNPKCFGWGIFAEALYGLGGGDIIPGAPFPGYASIGYRTIDIGSYLNFELGRFGTLTFLGWYNAYARNYALHSLGFAVNLLIPFSL
ncbi:MAG: hypothetical protein JJU12_07940 [Chlamydiales bacterium]|nr:hypothetical protein [Chlamydiales bacterium]